jgi:[ribosomal protein S5]-alanine N-acetyltransferase
VLTGSRVTLRPVREADLDRAWAHHVNIANRGEFYPLNVMSEPAFRTRFGETGFWEREEGVLLITGEDGEMAGEIEFFKPVHYWDAFEIAYLLYDPQYAGRGYVTEAVQLLTDYLFGSKKPDRVQLVILPENAASRRVAEKCGFVLEGTVRGAFFHRGRSNDVLLYSLLRNDPRPWHDAPAP